MASFAWAKGAGDRSPPAPSFAWALLWFRCLLTVEQFDEGGTRAVATAPRRKRPCRSLARLRSISCGMRLHWTRDEMNTVTPWITRLLLARSATPSPARISRIANLTHCNAERRGIIARLSYPYRPELHYMRDPSPKWRQKHGPSG